MDLPSLPSLLTVTEVAALLRTSPKAIQSAVQRGKLPGVVRVGRRILFRRDVFAALVSGEAVTS